MKKLQSCVSLLVLAALSLTEISSATEETGQSFFPVRNSDWDKRLYDFGLGKREYRYSSEFKRLPIYDFGLGKRAKLYGFGLGKKSDDNYDYDHHENDYDESILYDDEVMQNIGKRDRMYSFGLGKRPKSDFVLGKRLRNYNFGLGKRERLYNFGLGKRASKMYSFGLGKRADEGEDENIVKREAPVEHENKTVELESHESMGHSRLQKRNVGQYSSSSDTRDDLNVKEFNNVSDDEDLESFIRYYRRPAAYNFGLGKRRVYNFGLGKRNLEK